MEQELPEPVLPPTNSLSLYSFSQHSAHTLTYPNFLWLALNKDKFFPILPQISHFAILPLPRPKTERMQFLNLSLKLTAADTAAKRLIAVLR